MHVVPRAVNPSSMTETMQGVETMLRPQPSEWARLVAERFARLDDRGRTLRAELGLDPSRPVVMSGHQPQFWHPGILAKLYAMHAIARRTCAQAAWLVVDHDEAETDVRYPVLDRAGMLVARRLVIGTGEEGPLARMPAVSTVAMPVLAAGERFAAPGVEQGLAKIVEALRQHASQPNLARQIAYASISVACGGLKSDQPRIIFATDLARTTLVRELLGDMAHDPSRCAVAYNAAVAAHPAARVAPLATGEDMELPAWRIGPAMGSPRRHVRASMLGGAKGQAAIAAGEFVPRALLMTGMMRLAGCDLFIHGLGGGGSGGSGAGTDEGGYDAITAQWLRDWLHAEIGPLAVATATLRLRMASDGSEITPQQVAHAQWLAHAAEHRPVLLNDAEGERSREETVATLVKLHHRRDPASRAAKLSAYRSLHQTLQAARARRTQELAAIRDAAAAAASRRTEAELRVDRTWSSALYEPRQLAELDATIDAAMD